LKINVKFLATICEITESPKSSLISFKATPLDLALQTLQAHYGIEFKEATTGTTAGKIPKVRFLVNGRNTDFLEGLDTELKMRT